jgi:hypothetical protein
MSNFEILTDRRRVVDETVRRLDKQVLDRQVHPVTGLRAYYQRTYQCFLLDTNKIDNYASKQLTNMLVDNFHVHTNNFVCNYIG